MIFAWDLVITYPTTYGQLRALQSNNNLIKQLTYYREE